VESVAGSYTNVVGLPVERLRVELEGWTGAGAGNGGVAADVRRL